MKHLIDVLGEEQNQLLNGGLLESLDFETGSKLLSPCSTTDLPENLRHILSVKFLSDKEMPH